MTSPLREGNCFGEKVFFVEKARNPSVPRGRKDANTIREMRNGHVRMSPDRIDFNLSYRQDTLVKKTPLKPDNKHLL